MTTRLLETTIGSRTFEVVLTFSSISDKTYIDFVCLKEYKEYMTFVFGDIVQEDDDESTKEAIIAYFAKS